MVSSTESSEDKFLRIFKHGAFKHFETYKMDVTDDEISVIQKVMKNAPSTENIRWNCSRNPKITIDGYRTICTIIRTNPSSIGSLVLYRSGITCEVAKLIASMLLQSNGAPNLHTLGLSDNEAIEIEGFRTIAESLLSNTVLESLDLFNTLPFNISKVDQQQLGRLVQTLLISTPTKLRDLVLANVGLYDNFTLEFAKALRYNSTLQNLCLGGSITSVSIAALSKALQYNTSLEVLCLQRSILFITDEGLTLLFEALKYNTKIREIRVLYEHIQLTDVAIQSILESLEYNDTFDELQCDVPINGTYHVIQHCDPIRTILEQNFTRSRIAPKKGGRQREVIYRMLFVTWIYV